MRTTKPALAPSVDDPRRRGAEEGPAREGVIDGLVEPIERGEWADDGYLFPRREIVALYDAAADRIAKSSELIGDCTCAGRCFRGPHPA